MQNNAALLQTINVQRTINVPCYGGALNDALDCSAFNCDETMLRRRLLNGDRKDLLNGKYTDNDTINV